VSEVNVTKADAARVVESVIDGITESLKKGERTTIQGSAPRSRSGRRASVVTADRRADQHSRAPGGAFHRRKELKEALDRQPAGAREGSRGSRGARPALPRSNLLNLTRDATIVWNTSNRAWARSGDWATPPGVDGGRNASPSSPTTIACRHLTMWSSPNRVLLPRALSPSLPGALGTPQDEARSSPRRCPRKHALAPRTPPDRSRSDQREQRIVGTVRNAGRNWGSGLTSPAAIRPAEERQPERHLPAHPLRRTSVSCPADPGGRKIAISSSAGRFAGSGASRTEAPEIEQRSDGPPSSVTAPSASNPNPIVTTRSERGAPALIAVAGGGRDGVAAGDAAALRRRVRGHSWQSIWQARCGARLNLARGGQDEAADPA
jgi:nucleoid DNA-binding protein